MDVHRAVPRDLNEVLSWEEERVVQGDWTVACEGQAVSVGPATRGVESGAAEGDRADIAERAGAIGVSRQEAEVAGTARRHGAAAVKAKPREGEPAETNRRRRTIRGGGMAMGVGRKYWNGIKASRTRAVRLALRDSGRPPLRSGLPASRNPSREKTEQRTTNNKGDILS